MGPERCGPATGTKSWPYLVAVCSLLGGRIWAMYHSLASK